MAAYNILGQTIHSLFHLPVDQYSESDTGLSADIANTIHASLAELRVIIIDEISIDGALATALDNMSNRSMTPEDIELLRTRTFNSVPNDLNNTIFLFHKNADVDAKNTEILLSMTTQSATCTAIDRPSGNVTTQQADADLR
ncbi:hypothetical protein INT45_012700 [Circinella minor]|uniref:DNA helicase n=1 Tax=Circinella minor TaxID=1195481 RepID=A0A8H7RT19_9FUNG|nr:hypothetical protein INT45_012700 [Circinella minor]